MRKHQSLPYQHRAGVSPYTSSYELAEACVFNKQSPPQFCAKNNSLRYIFLPHLPKLRGYFAEFLQQSYLKGLSVLHPSTCGGLRYGVYKVLVSWKK